MSVIKTSWAGTLLFVVTALAAVVVPEPPVEVPAFVIAVGLFLAGCVAFVAGYARAVQRSREDQIGVADLFLLTNGVAQPEVRRALMGALIVEVVFALGTAIARPYSSLAAGTLVPVYGLGLCGFWASRFGTFPPRPAPDEPGHRPRGRPRPSTPAPSAGRTTPPGSPGGRPSKAKKKK